jgi:hypothetical protein
MSASRAARVSRAHRSLGALLPVLLLLLPVGAEGQLGWRDLVVTGGVSGEGYQGNLPSAGAVLQDSTRTASALVGEIGLRGDGFWRQNGTTRATLFVDGGLRQFAARGFQQRDYAPREWVGEAEATVYQDLGTSVLVSAFSGVRGRAVQDRTPMPLFLQPGYVAVTGGASLRVGTRGPDWLDLSVSGERADFSAPEFAPQVRLLDRESVTVQLAGARGLGPQQGLDAFVALDLAHYREQDTFNPDDPFRRDQTVRARVGWNYRGGVVARAGVEGRLNRSNSRRPEYRSVTLDGQVSAVIPGSAVATAYLVLTAKQYRESIPFARLLPGEEANSASTAFVSLSRELARNLDGALRVGWTRAEAETGDDYFQRMGVSLLLTYRPTL